MDMPTLDSLRGPMLDAPVFATLGTSIIYLPALGTAGLPTPSGDAATLFLDFVNNAYQLGALDIKALVNSEDGERAYGETKAIHFDPQFVILKSALPMKPSKGDRFTCDRYPGKVFRPANVMSSKSGTRWKFEGQIA